MDRLPAPQRSYSLSPELSVRPTTDELDRPEAISPAIDPPSRHVEGAVTGKGQLQSEVGPPWTRAAARQTRATPGSASKRMPTRVFGSRGPPNAALFKEATG